MVPRTVKQEQALARANSFDPDRVVGLIAIDFDALPRLALGKVREQDTMGDRFAAGHGQGYARAGW